MTSGISGYESDLFQARDLAMQEKPNAGEAKWASCAHAMAFLVYGKEDEDRFGGPTVRQRAVQKKYAGQQFDFEPAMVLLLDDEGLIFGPLTELHRECYRDSGDSCCDDDPDDVKFLMGPTVEDEYMEAMRPN